MGRSCECEMKTEYKKRVVLLVVLCAFIVGMYAVCGRIAGNRREEQKQTWTASRERNVKEAGTKGTLRLYVGELSGSASAFHWESVGDERLLSLVYQKIGDLAEVTQQKKGKGAVYRIRLREDVMDSDGKLVTADSLLYNYYMRCQVGYMGEDGIGGMAVRGMAAYRYGAQGKRLERRKKKVRQALRQPEQKLRQRAVKEIVVPMLYKEYYWVRGLYHNRWAHKICERYPEPVQLLAYYYAPDTSYTGKGRSEAQAVRDIAKQYGTNLEHLAEMTGIECETRLQGLAIQYYWPKQMAGSGQIAGIRKLDDRTVQIETTKYREEDQNKLKNMYLVTRKQKYSGSQNDAGETWNGTGAYILQEKDKDGIRLQVNSYYDREAVNPTQIEVQNGEFTGAQCIQMVCDGILDMACIWERADYEKKEISRAMKRGDSLWESALYGGLIYHPGRVNATTISKKMVDAENIAGIIRKLEMNGSD